MKKKHNDKLQSRIDIRAPWTVKKPTPPPERNYGRANMHLLFYVIGKKGAIELNVITDQKALFDRGRMLDVNIEQVKPLSEIYIHSKYKKYVDTDWTKKVEDCEVVDGSCYGSLWTTLDETWSEFIDNDEPTKVGADIIFNNLAERYYYYFYERED